MNNYVQKVDQKDLQPILEQINVIEELVSRFRGQVLKLNSLERKIRLLQEELKNLQVSINTSKRKINFSYDRLIEEQGRVLTEAVEPETIDWEIQYQLRRNRDLFYEMNTILESKMAEILEDGVLPK